LSRFSSNERAYLERYIETAVDALESLVRNGAQEAMNIYNKREVLI
jgi:peptidyl-tRNA hydrolase